MDDDEDMADLYLTVSTLQRRKCLHSNLLWIHSVDSCSCQDVASAQCADWTMFACSAELGLT